MRLILSKLLPRSLSGRMTLILVLGLLAAQGVGLFLHLQDRTAMLAAGHMDPSVLGRQMIPARFIWHLTLTLVAVVGISMVAVRWVTQPLQMMVMAATRFAHDLNAPALKETGPIEVRRAAEAFNFMQRRLRQLVVERGHALAAVSHDLRTPLTRMRLRVEFVDDLELQQKLNADIDAMQAMVNGVLGYLRGLEDTEPVQPINMEALLQSLVEDQRALGRNVVVVGERTAGVRLAPYAGKLSILRRAITNLIDNAVTHGHAVTVRLHDGPAELRVVVDDDGPGIPEAELARVTEPFVRLDAARGLAGCGNTPLQSESSSSARTRFSHGAASSDFGSRFR